jgi:hypothetical protein
MKKLMLLVPLAFSVSLQNANAFGKTKFSAYVTCEKIGGFVDNGVLDSQKDLERALSLQGFRLASSPQDADIVLTIASRFTGSQIAATNGAISGVLYPTNRPIVTNWHYVFVHLRAGEFEKNWNGYGRSWKDCASHLADEFKKFAKANESEILARRRMR